MTSLELISRLCEITELQADIINKQAEIIAQSDIADEVVSQIIHLQYLAKKDRNEIIGGIDHE